MGYYIKITTFLHLLHSDDNWASDYLECILLYLLNFSFQSKRFPNIDSIYILEIPYNEKLEHQRPLCIERERNPLHIIIVAMRCYAHYMMREVSLSSVSDAM